MKALIIVDYTRDFIADDGALTCGLPGQAIEPILVNLVEQFQAQNDFIVLATDKHDIDDIYHPESSQFPPHNLAGSPGRQFFGKLADLIGKGSMYQMDKRYYSAFAGTDLDIRLRERHIREIHLCGVCTDICILHTAIDAYNLGYDIVIYENAVASFDEIGHAYALNHFEKVLGASVVRGY